MVVLPSGQPNCPSGRPAKELLSTKRTHNFNKTNACATAVPFNTNTSLGH